MYDFQLSFKNDVYKSYNIDGFSDVVFLDVVVLSLSDGSDDCDDDDFSVILEYVSY